ncbi:MAG: trypsin-like peptidase domain-containing protein [Caldilineaceae bacterium]
MTALLTQCSNEMADVSQQVCASLVQIRTGRRGIGAGTIWHADGLIVTNAHVVQGAANHDGALIVGLADGRELPAQIVAVSATHDLALLRVATHDLPVIRLGDSTKLEAGAMVFAYGFPWGVTGGATCGVVIESGGGVTSLPTVEGEWIAASLHLRPGHSGGPMVDVTGALVGINTMMNGPDVGVAVPVHLAQAFVQAALVTHL